MYPKLENALGKLTIPVMAILGRLDTQVDWEAAGKLCAKALESGEMQLTQGSLDNSIMSCGRA